MYLTAYDLLLDKFHPQNALCQRKTDIALTSLVISVAFLSCPIKCEWGKATAIDALLIRLLLLLAFARNNISCLGIGNPQGWVPFYFKLTPSSLIYLVYHNGRTFFVHPQHRFVRPLNKGMQLSSTLSYSQEQLPYPSQVFLLLRLPDFDSKQNDILQIFLP